MLVRPVDFLRSLASICLGLHAFYEKRHLVSSLVQGHQDTHYCEVMWKRRFVMLIESIHLMKSITKCSHM